MSVLRLLRMSCSSTAPPLSDRRLDSRGLRPARNCPRADRAAENEVRQARGAAAGSLVYRLRAHLAEQPGQDSTALVFTNRSGNVLEYGNLLRRHLKPIVEEVNAPWAGLHTFRHTFASLPLSRGTNLLQLSRALGHHSAAFTLSRYTHLLPGDEAPALDLDLLREPSAPETTVAAEPT